MSRPSGSPDPPIVLHVAEENQGERLDVFLAASCEEHSRAQLRRAIDARAVTVDGRQAKASHRLRGGERIELEPLETPRDTPLPEAIPLDILYEDDAIAVVDKPPGMVVHPSRGHGAGTLVAALCHHFDRLSGAGGPTRPGVVHRLDRDTSGVILVAKTDGAHHRLAEQFAARTTEKEYLAIVIGRPDRDRDLIDRPIGVHPHDRRRMAIRAGHSTSREAQTYYEVAERFNRHALLRVLPKTGRTHQIRVHLTSVGLPILCDRLYGGHATITRGELSAQSGETSEPIDKRSAPRDAGAERPLLERQALHARRLTIAHPSSGETMTFEAPLPADLEAVLAELRTTTG